MHRWGEILLAWIPATLLYGLITYLSSQSGLPGPGQPLGDFLWFKSAHILVYGLLTLLVWFGWKYTVKQPDFWFPMTWFSLMILASLDEFHQSFVRGRGSSVRDIFIDLVAAAAVLWLLKRYNQSRLGEPPSDEFGE